MKKRIRIVFALILLGLVTVTTLQNTEVVTYRFLFWEFTMSRIIVLPMAVLAGLLAGLLLGYRRGRQHP